MPVHLARRRGRHGAARRRATRVDVLLAVDSGSRRRRGRSSAPARAASCAAPATTSRYACQRRVRAAHRRGRGRRPARHERRRARASPRASRSARVTKVVKRDFGIYQEVEADPDGGLLAPRRGAHRHRRRATATTPTGAADADRQEALSMRNAAFLGVGVCSCSSCRRNLLPRSSGTFRVARHHAEPASCRSSCSWACTSTRSCAARALAFVLGYLLDLFGGAPIGLFTFIYGRRSSSLARAAGVRLAAQTCSTQVALAFGFALVESVMVLVLLAIFGARRRSARARSRSLVAAARGRRRRCARRSSSASRERVHQATITVPRPDEGERAMSRSSSSAPTSASSAGATAGWRSVVVARVPRAARRALFQLQIVDGDEYRAEARARTSSDDVTPRDDARRHPRRAGQGARGEPPVVQRLRRARRALDMKDDRGTTLVELPAASAPTSAQRARDSTLDAIRRRHDGIAQAAADPASARTSRATSSPTLETHAARAARRRGRAGAGALLPVRASSARTCSATWREIDARDARRSSASAQSYRRGRSHRARPASSARWESYLRGQRGWEKVRASTRAGVSRNGPEAERLIDEPRRLEPIPGRDLRLTLDIELEQAIERAMRGQLAGARRRRRRAHRSRPRRSTRSRASIRTSSRAAQGKRASSATRSAGSTPIRCKPMLDKTMSGAYPPGSTFKPFTALAALEDELIDPRDRGRLRRRATSSAGASSAAPHVHGKVDLHEAHRAVVQHLLLQARPSRSAWTASREIGDRLRPRRRRPGIGVNPEARGPHADARLVRRCATRGSSAAASRCNAVDRPGRRRPSRVLQLALAYAALANGGTLYSAAARARRRDQRRHRRPGVPAARAPAGRRRAREPRARATRRSRGVVNEEGGTAYNVRASTASTSPARPAPRRSRHVTPRGVDPSSVWYFNRDHAWFAGYAPAQVARDRRSSCWSSTAAAAARTPRRRDAGRRASTSELAQQAGRDGARRGDAARRAPARWPRAAQSDEADDRRDPATSCSARVARHFDWPLFLAAALIAVHRRRQPVQRDQRLLAARARRHLHQQIYWLVVGGILGGVVAVDRLPPLRAPRLRRSTASASSALVLVFILGQRHPRLARAGSQFGSFRFQPSEFMKLVLVIALAKYLHDDPRTEGRTLKDLVVPALLTAVPVLLILRAARPRHGAHPDAHLRHASRRS